MYDENLFQLVLSLADNPSETARKIALTMCAPAQVGAKGPIPLFGVGEILYEIETCDRGSTKEELCMEPFIARRFRITFVKAVESYLGRSLTGFQLDFAYSEASKKIRTPSEVAAILLLPDTDSTDAMLSL